MKNRIDPVLPLPFHLLTLSFPALPSFSSSSQDTLPFDVVLPSSASASIEGQAPPTIPLGSTPSFDTSVDPAKVDIILLSLDTGEVPLLDETFPLAQTRLSSSCDVSPTVVLSSLDSDVIVELAVSPIEGGFSLHTIDSRLHGHALAEATSTDTYTLSWNGLGPHPFPLLGVGPCRAFPFGHFVLYAALTGGAAFYDGACTLIGGMHSGKLILHDEEDIYPPYVPTLRVIFYDETGCLGTCQYPAIPRHAILQDFYRGWVFIPKYTCNFLHIPVAIQKAEERPGTTLICALLSRTDWSFARLLCLLNPDCKGYSADTCLHAFRAVWLHGFVISEMCLRWSLDVPRFLDGFYLYPWVNKRPVSYNDAVTPTQGAYIFFSTVTVLGISRPLNLTPSLFPESSRDPSFYEDLDDLQLGTSLRLALCDVRAPRPISHSLLGLLVAGQSFRAMSRCRRPLAYFSWGKTAS